MRKEIRKLRRARLLELLADQEKEIEELKSQLQDAQEKLANRETAARETDPIAETSLRRDRVLESAQTTPPANQHLKRVHRIPETGFRAPEVQAELERERKARAMSGNDDE
ncbi:MAG: hypothetical protein LUI14_13320 [Lachnospiraceae bacterium]|nr:hypothetical protein [Lachnospiraceae bacterium]